MELYSKKGCGGLIKQTQENSECKENRYDLKSEYEKDGHDEGAKKGVPVV